jgi:hypothetical protein
LENAVSLDADRTDPKPENGIEVRGPAWENRAGHQAAAQAVASEAGDVENDKNASRAPAHTSAFGDTTLRFVLAPKPIGSPISGIGEAS